MKKIISILLVLCMLAALAGMAVSAASRVKLGDADGDNDVSSIDATLIQRKLVGLNVVGFNEKAADIDGKGLDITDATWILRYLAEMTVPYSIGKPMDYELPYVPSH